MGDLIFLEERRLKRTPEPPYIPDDQYRDILLKLLTAQNEVLGKIPVTMLIDCPESPNMTILNKQYRDILTRLLTAQNEVLREMPVTFRSDNPI